MASAQGNSARFKVLGPLEVIGPNGPLQLGGVKQRSVLGILVLHANRVISVERLIAGVWGDHRPNTSISALQVYVSKLRQLLRNVQTTNEPILTYQDPGYVLRIDHAAVDATIFERLLEKARQGRLRGRPAIETLQCLDEALALWRGPALYDLTSVPFAAPIAQKFEEMRIGAIEDRFDARLALGEQASLIGELGEAVQAHPLRERVWCQLATALVRSNRQAEALQAVQKARRMLVEELGVDPGQDLQVLERQILQQDQALVGNFIRPGPAEGGGGDQLTRHSGLVPTPLDRTFGRDDDLDWLAKQVVDDRVRLVSIIGPSGVGKTRVATALAHRCDALLGDDVWFVRLADAETSDDVVPVLAGALNVSANVTTIEGALAGVLSDRSGLLILDNFEHVIGAAPVLERILAAAPTLTAIATSRRGLGIAGERRYRLSPLRVQSSNGDMAPAVGMFLDRLTAGHPTFEPTSQQLDVICSICANCDGLPLAIELVAARAGVFTLGELEALTRDGRSLDIRPTTAADTSAPLRAGINASFSTLDPEDQVFLGRVSIFRGGFTLEAAAAVAALTIDTTIPRVESLLDRSLLYPRESSVGRRFDMLQTVRAFVTQEMPAAQRTAGQRRHAQYFHRFVQPNLVEPAWGGPHTPEPWAAQLAERPNLRAAIRWSCEADPQVFVELVLGAANMWGRIGPYQEMGDWLRKVLELSVLSAKQRVAALVARSWLAFEIDDLESMNVFAGEAEQLAEQSGDRSGLNAAAEVSALLACITEDHTRAAHYAEWMSQCCSTDLPPVERTFLLQMTAIVRAHLGEAEEAVSITEAGLAVAEEHNLFVAEIMALNCLCEAGLFVGRNAAVIAWANKGLKTAALHGLTRDHGCLLSQLGLARLNEADVPGAGRALVEALKIFRGGAGNMEVVECVLRLAAVYAVEGQDEAAAELYGIFSSGIHTMGMAAQIGQTRTIDRYLTGKIDTGSPPLAGFFRGGIELVEERGIIGVLPEVLRKYGRPGSDEHSGRKYSGIHTPIVT